MNQKRGRLSDEIKAKSKELLGYEITRTELRLMNHIAFCLTDFHRVDRNKISDEELGILLVWEEAGYITLATNGTTVTTNKKFWDIISEIIYLGYVDTKLINSVPDK